jgi:hypothetical protein
VRDEPLIYLCLGDTATVQKCGGAMRNQPWHGRKLAAGSCKLEFDLAVLQDTVMVAVKLNQKRTVQLKVKIRRIVVRRACAIFYQAERTHGAYKIKRQCGPAVTYRDFQAFFGSFGLRLSPAHSLSAILLFPLVCSAFDSYLCLCYVLTHFIMGVSDLR